MGRRRVCERCVLCKHSQCARRGTCPCEYCRDHPWGMGEVPEASERSRLLQRFKG